MRRLPIPGGDDGSWGQILNDFLSVEHNADGTLNPSGSLSLKYAKPALGIPKTDLEATVQSDITKIPGLETNLATKADASAVSTLQTRTNAIEAPGWVNATRMASGSVPLTALSSDVVAAAITRPAQTARRFPLPPVNSLAATVTEGVGSAASVITSGVDLNSTYDSGIGGVGGWKVRVHRDWRYNYSRMKVRNTDPGVVNWARDRNAVISTVRSLTFDLVGNAMGMYSVEFLHYGDQLEVRAHGQAGSIWRVLVDGQYVQLAPYASVAPDGLVRRHRIDFANGTVDAPTRKAARKIRRVEIECDGSFSFMGLTIGPTDSVWAPTNPRAPKLMVITDSYGNTGSLSRFTAFPLTLGRLIGYTQVYNDPLGGSGYVAVGTEPIPGPFIDRVNSDLPLYQPDMLVFLGSQNDPSADPAGITAAALAAYKRAREIAPTTRMVVVGRSPLSGSPAAVVVQANLAVRTAAVNPLSGVDLYIDLIGGPVPYDATTNAYQNKGLFRGTGKVSTPTGTGNNDEFYGGLAGTDAQHPTQAGHDALAYFLAQAIGEWQDAGSPRAEWRPGVGLIAL